MPQETTEIHSNTMVSLSLDPGGFHLSPGQQDGASGRETALVRCEDGLEVARFWVPAPGPGWEILWSLEDEGTGVSDALYLFSMTYLVDKCENEHLDDIAAITFRRRRGGDTHLLPHPPQMVSIERLLARWPARLRIRLLAEACEIAVPIWSRWAKTAVLSYYDGIASMAEVDPRLAEDTICAVRSWLVDAETEPLEARVKEYRRLHWPRLEDEWSCPENVYYGLYAANNLAEAAINGGVPDALTCIRQAVAARATDGSDRYLGYPFVDAFLREWWRRVVSILVEDGP